MTGLPLRAAFCDNNSGEAPTRLALTSLAEHAAWEKLAGLPSGGSRPAITHDDCKRVLGLPSDIGFNEDEEGRFDKSLLGGVVTHGGADDGQPGAAIRSRVTEPVGA
jgi:hypothetical protein